VASITDPVRESRRRIGFQAELEAKGWYHSFELPGGSLIDGYIPVSILRERWGRFPVPAELAGKRVLDIGAWDGWFSFEAERRGAEVIAIDCVEVANFLEVHRRLGSKVDYRVLDVFELPAAGLGTFDYVFFLGVLYHVRHPLLALEIVCALTTETAIVESFVTDSDDWREHERELPTLEFYETDELGGQLDNWFGPTVGCVMAMCRAAGFARVELLYAKAHLASVACHRRWEPPPPEAGPAPELAGLANTRDTGINFSSRREEYITCWFRCARAGVSRADLRLEAGGLGAPALFVGPDAGGWIANFLLPPGLKPGWHEVRLRLRDTAFSAPLRIAVDVPAVGGRIELAGACDGVSWAAGEVGESGHLALWVSGLGDTCDRANVGVYLGESRLAVEFVSQPNAQGYRQVNASVRQKLDQREHPLRVEFAGAVSNSLPIRVA
jgi:tRNA (mo5U34)-methyltransferase